jgi:hypothetical protein
MDARAKTALSCAGAVFISRKTGELNIDHQHADNHSEDQSRCFLLEDRSPPATTGRASVAGRHTTFRPF